MSEKSPKIFEINIENKLVAELQALVDQRVRNTSSN